MTAPPRDTSRVFVVERAGRIQVVKSGTRVGTPFLDISGDVDQAGERGLLSMTFAPDYATLRAVLRLHGRAHTGGRDPDPRVQALGHERRPRRPDRADRLPGDAQRGVEPQRRPGRVGAGRLPVVRDRRRRRGQRRPQPRARPLEPARQGAADRPAAGQRGELRDPGEQPVRHRGLGLRPAQPVPLLVRPRVGRPVDRGRRPGRARGGRPARGRGRPGARRRLRLGVQGGHGRRAEGLHGQRVLHPAGLRLRQRGRHARGDGRLPGARPGAADAARPLRVRGRLRRPGALASHPPRRGRRTPRSPSLAVRNTLVSFGEDACGHVYVVSIDRGSVERIQDGAPGACVLKPAPPALPPLGGTGGGGAVVRPGPTAPPRACGSGSRARAASGAARGRRSRSPRARPAA